VGRTACSGGLAVARLRFSRLAGGVGRPRKKTALRSSRHFPPNLARRLAVMLLGGRDSPDSVSQHRRVLAQVRQAGVRHVVKLSAIGASPESPIALMREHHEVDEEVRKGPSSWTLLNPHFYMQNLLRAATAVRAAPMGRKSVRPRPWSCATQPRTRQGVCADWTCRGNL
jgi:hypothetical protein